MKKLALVFLVAVFLPSLVLAWLAVHSLTDEQLALERQQTLLCQGVADRLRKVAEEFLTDRQREFGDHVEAMLAKGESTEVTRKFDDLIRDRWPLADVGFVVSLEGSVLCPSLFGRAEARNFRLQNDRFLCSRESVEVYWNPGTSNSEVAYKLEKRSVLPEKEPLDDPKRFSKVTSSEAEFRQLIGSGNEGTLARFLQNRLTVMFWHRSIRDPQLVFGAQLNLPRLQEGLSQITRAEPEMAHELAVALLDDNGRPVAVSPMRFHANWRHPFVAAEIGEALPHWEVAVYLINPGKIGWAAEKLKYSVSLLVAFLVLAISIGGWLIVKELRRELTLARQKTDFVSNVSHELKTPLTSIRMFSELLAEDRVTDVGKRRSYLAIITAETARLTRLINNVLDFSRMERGEKEYHFEPCDLTGLVRDIVESYRPHLEAAGFALECDLPATAVRARGDRDALAQVLVNLISNAEKYSGEKKEVTIRLRARSQPVAMAEISVLDRGPGVPSGSEERIFEQFYRAHDSLSSGIQGSGLGLTLARQIARAHGGEVSYEPREGGGSCFTVRLPAIIPSEKTT